MKALSDLYGRIARSRRAWYTEHPQRQRHLSQPVVSVGNLVLGGSGKTPVVAALARLLLSRGERPSVLTRGYGRRRSDAGVVVVSDLDRVLEPTGRSGDEPQMLARALPGVPVLVSADRYLAGCLAERQFGSTVHLLDDGFQHVRLARNVDLLLLSAADLEDRPLPSGRLREPIETARHAHALLVSGSEREAEQVAIALGRDVWYQVVPRYGSLRPLAPPEVEVTQVTQAVNRVIAVAGIARPERFFNALTDLGLDVCRQFSYPDHHWFDRKEIESVHQAAREAGVDAIVTTEKDAMRLVDLPVGLLASNWVFLPMEVEIRPADRFSAWILERLAAARRAGRPVQ